MKQFKNLTITETPRMSNLSLSLSSLRLLCLERTMFANNVDLLSTKVGSPSMLMSSNQYLIHYTIMLFYSPISRLVGTNAVPSPYVLVRSCNNIASLVVA
jgi:hypothetical protein